jgi:hypothetical protein
MPTLSKNPDEDMSSYSNTYENFLNKNFPNGLDDGKEVEKMAAKRPRSK